MTSYRAPWWLPEGHSQTLHAALMMRRPRVAYRRERWDTPDGDFIDLDWVAEPSAVSRQPSDTRPLVVMFHGLEGSSRSHYALALMSALGARGIPGVVVHFRGCSGEVNRLPRAYHSGDSAEIDWVLRRLGEREGRLRAVGVSLGGNALLKWLGETGASAGKVVDQAAAVSAPVDLMAAGNALDRGINLIYVRHFLATMKRKALEKLERYPGLYDAARVRAARTLRAFDDCVTAPLHGFAGVDDYWTRASAKPWLRDIAVRTLMINARNDPFLPAAALPLAGQTSAALTLEFPRDGGHVAFVAAPFPGRLDWLPRRLLEFFDGVP